MPASKKSKSLGEFVKDAGLVTGDGLCPLLLVAADSVWVRMGNHAITLPMAAWLHQQVLGISITPSIVMGFFEKLGRFYDTWGDGDGVYKNGQNDYRLRLTDGFLHTASAKAWCMHCGDVDALVFQLTEVPDYPPPSIYTHDVRWVGEGVEDAEQAFSLGKMSRDGWVYGGKGEDDASPFWHAPDDDDRYFAQKVAEKLEVLLEDTSRIERFAKANKEI